MIDKIYMLFLIAMILLTSVGIINVVSTTVKYETEVKEYIKETGTIEPWLQNIIEDDYISSLEYEVFKIRKINENKSNP